MRTCLVCKTSTHRSHLLRFVGRPGQVLIFDVQGKLPGRGMWVHANGNCLQQAIDKHLFYKAAKGTVRIPDNFIEQVQNQCALFRRQLNSDREDG